MFEIRSTDFNKVIGTAPTNTLRSIIEITDLFHITQAPNGVTYFAGTQDDNYNLTFPSRWELYCDETPICITTLIGTMSHNLRKPEQLTVIAEGHVDKTLFDFDKKMCFKRVNNS